MPSPTRPRPQRFQRDRNLSLVMNALRENSGASRSELAATLGLDRSTLTHLSNELLAAQLVVEDDERSASARGGRRPRPLRLNPDRYAVLGVDIRARDAQWALLRLDGTVRESGTVSRGDDGAIQWLQNAASATINAVTLARNGGTLHLLGVGVSVPGVVDNKSGMLVHSVALGLDSVRVPDYWSQAGTKVLVDNDANCCAWNLAVDPLQPRNIVVSQIKLHQTATGTFHPSGAGIGLAFVLDGSIYYGTRGAAGELRGVGWTGATPDQLGLRLDRIQAEHGDAEALRALAAETLRNLSVVVSVLDPDCLVVAGDVAPLSAPFSELLSGAPEGSPIANLAAAGSVVIAAPQEYPAAQGAARMVLARLFYLADGAGPALTAGNDHVSDGWQSIIEGVIARR
jgi:ROK family protein